MTFTELVESLGSLGLAWPDNATAHATLKTPLTVEMRCRWQKLLRQAYGCDALAVGYAVLGRDLDLEALGAMLPHLEAWKARVQECPTLAPLLGPFLKVRLPPPENWQVLKQGVLRKGVNDAAWRWLCRQSTGAVRKLVALGWSTEAVCWVTLLAKSHQARRLPLWCLEAGRPHLFSDHYAVLSTWSPEARTQELLNLERLFRLIPEEASLENLRGFEVLASALMVSMLNPRWSLKVKPGMTWTSVITRVRKMNQERARLALAAARASQNPNESFEWKPKVGDFVHQNVHAKELTSTYDLRNEGSVMSHCVGNGGYTAECLAGSQAVFSLEEPVTQSRATLQLRYSKPMRRWLIVQLAGFGNSVVPQMFWNAARALQRAMPA